MSHFQDKVKELQPKRMDFAINELTELGIKLTYQDDTSLKFFWKGSDVTFYPYTGWHTGKTITDGRGLNNLLKQLK